MSGHPIQPFSVPQMKDFVPKSVRPWIFVMMVIVVQLSGGVYMSAAGEMVGSTALLQEDIMMAGYASLVGMALFFPIMFRLRSAVRPKTALTSCFAVIIAANLIAMHTTNIPLLVGVCLVAGFFRMWATLECNSTIQLWITPTRDLSVFFCYVYLLVNSCIQLSGIASIHFASWASWHYMHWGIIALLLLMWIVVMFCMKGCAVMPRLPLLGIDWIGMIIWGFWAMCILFICLYGEHYDWWEGEPIRTATLFAVISLLMNLLRASFIRHPYVSLKTLSFKVLPIVIGITIVADILLAPSHIFEHILMEGILGYDAENMISLNWVALTGTIFGAGFTWLTFARRKWTYQRMMVIAFTCLLFYVGYFYFMIDYNIPYESLVPPIFVRSVGYTMLSIVLLTSLTRLPFPTHFTQGVGTLNMFSAALAGVIGTAIIGRILNVVTARNFMLLSSEIDATSYNPDTMPLGELYGAVQVQSLLEAMKEIYGWLIVVAIACLIILSLRKSDIQPTKVIQPTFRRISLLMRRELLLRLRQRRRHRAAMAHESDSAQ